MKENGERNNKDAVQRFWVVQGKTPSGDVMAMRVRSQTVRMGGARCDMKTVTGKASRCPVPALFHLGNHAGRNECFLEVFMSLWCE